MSEAVNELLGPFKDGLIVIKMKQDNFKFLL